MPVWPTCGKNKPPMKTHSNKPAAPQWSESERQLLAVDRWRPGYWGLWSVHMDTGLGETMKRKWYVLWTGPRVRKPQNTSPVFTCRQPKHYVIAPPLWPETWNNDSIFPGIWSVRCLAVHRFWALSTWKQIFFSFVLKNVSHKSRNVCKQTNPQKMTVNAGWMMITSSAPTQACSLPLLLLLGVV